jgi:hypothetical protein
MKNTILSILLISLLTFSCTKNTDLYDSTYINDANFNGLPAYSEWGYNTFGAYYDRDYFTYSDQETPLKISVSDNEISYIFQGTKGRNNYNDYYMALVFILPDSTSNEYQDLMTYNKKIIDLTNSSVRVELTTNGSTSMVEVIEGSIEFKRVQKLYIDDEENQLIMSGIFELQILDNNIPINISYGRFDCGVDDLVFYNLR